MVSGWSEQFLALQKQGTITGFAFITAQGPSKPVTGPFEQECAHGSISPAVQQLIRTFYEAAEPPTSYELWGKKLIVLHQTDSCYIAVSGQRSLGIIAVNLPGGVLLASFARDSLPTTALLAVQETCAAAFKRKRQPSDN